MTLTLQGNGTLNGLTVLGAPVTTLANTGTAASPSLVFDGDSDTGLFRPGANQLGLSVGGSARLTIASDGTTTFTNLETSAGSLTFGDYSSTTASSAKIWNNNSYGLYINGTGDSTHTAVGVYKVDSPAGYQARIFHDGSATFAGGTIKIADVGDNSNSVRITTDPASSGSASKLIFNMDSSQDTVTIYNAGLKVGDSNNTERINLNGSNGNATFTGYLRTISTPGSGTYVQVDDSDGFTVVNSNITKATINMSGAATFDSDAEIGTAAADARITIGSHGTAGTNDSVHIRADSQNLLFMSGSGGLTIFESNGSETIRILSTGGITFNGDTATANALDDYEEGNWTPVGNNNFNGITNAEGYYTKVGKIVTVNFQFNYTSLDDSTDYSAVGGLPFQPGDYNSNTGVEATNCIFGTNKLVLNYVNSNSSVLFFETSRPIAGSASTGADFFRGSIVYMTA